MQTECEILNFRKNNLLENIVNQDKILEEKFREGEINQQVNREILFYWHCDVTKDTENVNKEWGTKIVSMTKTYEKDKRFLETEKERRIRFHQNSPRPNTTANNINENLESTSNKTCHSREETRNVQTDYQKIDKYKKKFDNTKILSYYERRCEN